MATTRGGKTWIERNRNAAAEKFYRLIIDSIVQSLHISGYPTHCRVFILGNLRYMSFAFRAFAITIMFFYPCYHSFKICASVLSLSFEYSFLVCFSSIQSGPVHFFRHMKQMWCFLGVSVCICNVKKGRFTGFNDVFQFADS